MGLGTGAGTQGAFDLGMSMQLAGGIYQALQANAGGNAEAAAYEYQAKQFEAEAKGVMDKAHSDVVLFNEQGRRFTAGQRAEAAAGGMAGSQSALEIMSDTERQIALDSAAIKFNADLQAGQLRNQAYYSRLAAKNAKIAGRTRALTSLLSTATQVADIWYQRKQTGMGKEKATTGGGGGSSKQYSQW